MKVNRSCWCTLSPTKGLELTSWTFFKYKSQFMERSVYACKAMLLLRLNYFELKVLRVHCTGGVFALRTLSAVNAELHRICIENWCFLWRRSLTATGQSVESVEESSLCFQKFHTVPALHASWCFYCDTSEPAAATISPSDLIFDIFGGPVTRHWRCISYHF